MKLIVSDNENDAGVLVCKKIIEIINNKPNALICLAAGHSSIPVFKAMIEASEQGEVDFSSAFFVGLDEWLNVPITCKGTCYDFMMRNIYLPLKISESKLCLFNPMCGDTVAECVKIESFIKEHNGIDFLLLGMGMNGHLALNEPNCDFNQGAHVTPLSKTTLEVAPKYFEKGDFPNLSHGITLGIKNLLQAKVICLTVFGKHKHSALMSLLQCDENPIFPASILNKQENAFLFVDIDSYN